MFGGSLYSTVNEGADTDWALCYHPYEHPEVFSGEPILEGASCTCSIGWITLTKVLVLQGIQETMVSASQPERRIATAAESAHSVGGHLAWLAHCLRGLLPATRDALAKGYGALLAMFRRPPGPQHIAVLAWARPIIGQSQGDYPLYLIKAHLEQHPLLAWRFGDGQAEKLLQAVGGSHPPGVGSMLFG